MGGQAGTFSLPFSTSPNSQDPTTYKTNIDNDFLVLSRVGCMFMPSQTVPASMRIAVGPGAIYSGGTGITEAGAFTTGTLNGTTTVTVADATGLSGTMMVTSPRFGAIPPGTTATNSGTTVTLSAAAGISASNVPLIFWQRTSVITAPVSNSRIDRVVADATTGAISIITGTPSVTPTPPAFTAGVIPIAQILLTSSTTSISNSMITDERSIGMAGSIADGNKGDITVSGGGLVWSYNANSITGGDMVNQTITATQIANSTITATQIANSTITGGKIASNTIALSQLTTQAANTVVVNATGSTAALTALSLASSSVLGRGSSGDIVGLTAGTGISFGVSSISCTITSPVKAWVNINGGSAANQTATYSRTGTTVTVTLASHGHLVGHRIYNQIDTGTATSGIYTITSVATNTFTYTDTVSGATSGNCTLRRRTMRASSGVHSVAYLATGNYAINWSSLQTDGNYILSGAGSWQVGVTSSFVCTDQIFTPTTAAMQISIKEDSSGTTDSTYVSVGIIGN